MNDVEVVHVLVYIREHRELQEGSKILPARQAQRLRTGRMQLGAGCTSPAAKKRHVMTAAYEFLSDVRGGALGAAILIPEENRFPSAHAIESRRGNSPVDHGG